MENKPEKIKILELIDTYYPTVDGAISVAKHYCEELNKIAECKLAAPKAAAKDKYVDNESFEVFRCSSTPAPEGYRLGSPDQDGKFVKKIKEQGFDIYHVHSPFAMGRFALKMAKKADVPVVATLHTQYHQDFERVLNNNRMLVDFMINYILKVYQNADSVWTVSNRSCQYLREYGYTGKIEVIRNGTDFKYPENAEELIDKVNAIQGLEKDELVFLFVGRMAWYKNLKIILDSLEIVKNAGKKFKMIFVGGGFDYDEVVAYAKEKGLDECVFTGAVKDRELLQGYYLRADLLLFPSTFDMAPVTAVEAAAHNLASVMVDGSCSAEQIEDGVNGFLAEENAESFANRILSIIDDRALIKSVGERAGKTLYRSWEMVAEEVHQKYLEVIKEYKKNKEIMVRLKAFKDAKIKAEKEEKKALAKQKAAQKKTEKKKTEKE